MAELLWLDYSRKTDDGLVRVVGVHHKPEMLTDAELAEGVLIEKERPLPPEVGKGEQAALYVDEATKEMKWLVEPRPLTEAELLEDVLTRLASVEAKLDKLLSESEVKVG